MAEARYAKSGSVAKNAELAKLHQIAYCLRSNSEDLVDEEDLSHDISFFNSIDLTFANHIHHFVASERSTSRVEGGKA